MVRTGKSNNIEKKHHLSDVVTIHNQEGALGQIFADYKQWVIEYREIRIYILREQELGLSLVILHIYRVQLIHQ